MRRMIYVALHNKYAYMIFTPTFRRRGQQEKPHVHEEGETRDER